MRKLSRSAWCVLTVWLLVACSRTATDAAVQVSGLSIPKTAKVLRFVDSPSGMLDQDLTLEIELELTAVDYARLEADARARGYLPLRRPLRDDSIPFDFVDGKATAPNGFGTAVRELKPGATGWFLGKGNVGRGSVVTLDPSRRRLIISAWIV